MIERHDQHQRDHEEYSYIQRRLTEHMETYVQPIGADSEGANVEPEAKPRCLTRRRTLPQPHQKGGTENRQRPPLQWRKRTRKHSTRTERHPAPYIHDGGSY